MNDEARSEQMLIAEIKELKEQNARLKALTMKCLHQLGFSGTETLLVVDDNEPFRKSCVSMLADYGYTVLEAESPFQAIEIFKAGMTRVDLVLVDIVMPEMGGPEMVQKMKAIQPGIKVIFMSGYSKDDLVITDVEEVLQSDAVFISKPFATEKITMLLRQVLDGDN